MAKSSLRKTAPNIIQGGMGVAVSSWELAKAVAMEGEIGVVSATCIDTVMVRELQDGDPYNRLDALGDYPDPEIADYIKETFYIEGGKPPEESYKLLPMHRFNPTIRSQRILSAAAFTEVYMAKQGHDGLIGINLLGELKRFSLACMYGAMLADVDSILMGAGIPKEEAEQVHLLAKGKPARLRLEVDKSQAENPEDGYFYELDPSDLLDHPPILEPPEFYPIIASDVLAKILDHKLPSEYITGWIIEGPVAGGHNAPPRGKQYDEEQNPVYDDRDIVNLDKVAALGYPYYLAGGFGRPEHLTDALDKGARGIQVGSLFSLANESGYAQKDKERIIRSIHRDEVTIRTDGRISPTGFPFKVVEVEGTLGIPENYEQRTRICDLGYLQKAYLDEKGRLRARCPSEPKEVYVKKGGKLEDTHGRGCLCNGLFANIDLAQKQKWGEEGQLFTGGDDLVNLPLGTEETPRYSAVDVIDYLYGEKLPENPIDAPAESYTS